MIEAERCHNCGACLSVCPVYKALRCRDAGVQGSDRYDPGADPRRSEPLAPDGRNPEHVPSVHGLPGGLPFGRFRPENRHGRPAPPHREKGTPSRQAVRFSKAAQGQKGPSQGSEYGRGRAAFFPGRRAGKAQASSSDPFRAGREKGPSDPGPNPLERTDPRGHASVAERPKKPDGSRSSAGCYMEFVDTTIVEEGIRVLASQGFEVVYPKSQICCGAPVLYSGDLEGAKGLAMENAGVFAGQEDIKAVVTLCATCNSALKEGYRTVAENLQGVERERVLALSCKIMDFSRIPARTCAVRGLQPGASVFGDLSRSLPSRAGSGNPGGAPEDSGKGPERSPDRNVRTRPMLRRRRIVQPDASRPVRRDRNLEDQGRYMGSGNGGGRGRHILPGVHSSDPRNGSEARGAGQGDAHRPSAEPCTEGRERNRRFYKSSI